MIDYLAEFTPEELELIRGQNGKFILHDHEIEFECFISDELSLKMRRLFFTLYAELVRDPETRCEALIDPHQAPEKVEEDTKAVRQQITQHFLDLFGLTEEKKPAPALPAIPHVKFFENSVQFVPTSKKYYGAFLPQKNPVAYIAKYDKQLQFVFDENGIADIDVLDTELTYDEISKKTIPADCADTDLLMTFAAAVAASYIKNRGYIITVYLPEFARAMHVQFETDGKEQKQYNLKGKLKDLEDIIGILVEQRKIQFAFKIIELDQDKRELTFASPYLYSIMDMLKNDPIVSKTKHNNQLDWSITGESWLIGSEINTARNKVTAEIMRFVISQIHQRGRITDAKRKPQKEHEDNKRRTKEITYKEIIKNCPRLRQALEEVPPKRRNQVLKRAIYGDSYNFNSKKKQTPQLEEYMAKYTDAFNYWKDFSITFESEAPSAKKLDAKIKITHHGVNAAWNPKYQLPIIDEEDGIFDDV